MSTNDEASKALAAKQRIEKALEALRAGLSPYVAKHMQDRHGDEWRLQASRARGADAAGELDPYGLLKTVLEHWNDLFRHDSRLRSARSFVSLALDARNSTAHFTGALSTREALRHLDAMRELLAAVGATAEATTVEALYEEQRAANGIGTESRQPGPVRERASSAGAASPVARCLRAAPRRARGALLRCGVRRQPGAG